MAMVVSVARKRTRGTQHAEDFAQEATTRAIVKSRKTGEPKPPPVTTSMVLLFIGSILNTLTFNSHRGDKRHPHTALDDSDPRHLSASMTPSPEQLREAYHADAELDRMETELRAELAADPEGQRIPLAMFKLAADGVEKNADFAARLECRVEDIENARKRLARQGERILQRAGAGDAPS